MTSKKKNYDEAADWAEHEMTLPENSKTARRGAAAAEAGRALLARAHAGRPSLDPQAKPGEESPRRQVRLPLAVSEQWTRWRPPGSARRRGHARRDHDVRQ